jgi:phosphoglycolate phosphatase
VLHCRAELRFRLAIFDLDGTLVDTLGDIADALNFTLRSFGVPVILEARVAGLVGEGVTRLLEKAGASRLDEAAAMFRARYTAHLIDRTRPYAGIPEMLSGAPQRKAVATNKPGAMARAILKELGLIDHFARVLGDDDLSHRKPDPEVVEILLRDLGTRREETILVGDGVVDARTARAAGVAFCAVTWGYVPREELAAEQPAYCVDTPAELQRLLG